MAVIKSKGELNMAHNQGKEKQTFNFQRVEKKFWLTNLQYREIMQAIEKHTEADSHGQGILYNLYFDTEDYLLIRRSIGRPNFKEKLRIRSYSPFAADSLVFAEVKRKVEGIGYKRRCVLPFEERVKIMTGLPVENMNIQAREICLLGRRYGLEPKILLSYRRQAFYGKDNRDLRITFDSDIKFRQVGRDLSKTQIQKLPCKGDYLMEVKSGKGLPRWFLSETERLKIYQSPFSKVGRRYETILNNKNFKEAL